MKEYSEKMKDPPPRILAGFERNGENYHLVARGGGRNSMRVAVLEYCTQNAMGEDSWREIKFPQGSEIIAGHRIDALLEAEKHDNAAK